MRIQSDRFKPILRADVVFIACVIWALLFTPQAWGQATEKDKTQPDTETPPKVHVTVEVGGQVREIQGGHTAKFQETRDVPKGFFIQRLRMDFNSADSPYYLSMRGLRFSSVTSVSLWTEGGSENIERNLSGTKSLIPWAAEKASFSKPRPGCIKSALRCERACRP